ncbi:hypothetical protein D3C76_1147030 [compost metagenome]
MASPRSTRWPRAWRCTRSGGKPTSLRQAAWPTRPIRGGPANVSTRASPQPSVSSWTLPMRPCSRAGCVRTRSGGRSSRSWTPKPGAVICSTWMSCDWSTTRQRSKTCSCVSLWTTVRAFSPSACCSPAWWKAGTGLATARSLPDPMGNDRYGLGMTQRKPATRPAWWYSPRR